jgi:aryl-alcohol dehydrogenase-like predicted oxidoreductase
MTLRTLGQTDLKITPIGIGAWAIGGGKWEFAWGHQEDAESIAAIHAGLDRGINWIDTAAVYGLGHSETVVGRAINGLAKRPYVFTKCSLVWDKSGKITHNLRAASIRREAESSLKRLQIDMIDLYQIHWPDWHGAPERQSARWPNSRPKARSATSAFRISMRGKCNAPCAWVRSHRSSRRIPSLPLTWSLRFFPLLCNIGSASSSIPPWRPDC